jgi:hypothetical protein
VELREDERVAEVEPPADDSSLTQDHGFNKNEAVRRLLAQLVREKIFVISSIKRSMHMFCLQYLEPQVSSQLGMLKPNGLYIQEMFDAEVFTSGDVPLEPSTHTLDVNIMDQFHMSSCRRCKEAKSIDSGCYFALMRKCVTHGWRPPVKATEIRQRYQFEGNYKSFDNYDISVAKEFAKMIKHGVAIPCVLGRCGVESPMSAVIKNSDHVRAETLVGIKIVDQASLTLASSKLEQMGLREIKARVAIDLTASGVNDASYRPPFRYPGLSEGLKMVTRGCWIGKGDVERYFYCFPIASHSVWMFMVKYLGILYYLVRCCFGFGPCPYYCQSWSAEFRSWILAEGVESVVMVDDWLVTGEDEAAAKENIGTVTRVIEGAGLKMSKEKEEVGQRIVYVGVMIDTINMTLSFEATSAKGMELQLKQYLLTLEKGKDLDPATIRHVAGKLGWYCEVLQSGRVHVRSWWAYQKFGKHLHFTSRVKLIQDTTWWIGVLNRWASDNLNGLEYPILSASELLDQPDKMYLVQSDASGTDGFGYFEGYLTDEDPKFTAGQWTQDFQFVTSHNGELKALQHFVQQTSISRVMLVWISDSLSAVWSVNKGRCKEECGLITLRIILEECDNKRLQIIAIWVPRELNLIADYLSHLASSLHRDLVRGRLGDLGSAQSHRGRGIEQETPEVHPENRQEILGLVLQSQPIEGVSNQLQIVGRVPVQTRPEEPRINPVGRQRSVGTESLQSAVPSRMAQPERAMRAKANIGAVDVQGLEQVQKEATSRTGAADRYDSRLGPRTTSAAASGSDVHDLPQRTSSQWRASVGNPSVRSYVGETEKWIRAASKPNQEMSIGRRRERSLHRLGTLQRSLASAKVVRPARPVGKG